MLLDQRRLLNISLRLATLGTRFGFVFVLAKYIDAESVGYYGIFTATIGYALLAVGLDFYTFSTREIIQSPNDQRGRFLKSQAVLALGLYLILAPLAALLLTNADWPMHLLWWFIPILLLEHLNQELYRIFIVLSEQVTASMLLFIRQGSWAIIAIAIFALNPSERNLETVMMLWAGSGLLTSLLGMWKIKRSGLGGWRSPIDWKWIKRGVTVSATFLIATLALRGVQTMDRYWLQALAGIDMVGAYVLFFGVASALMVFLDAAIFSFFYPELIGHHSRQEFAEARQKISKTLKLTLAATFGFFLVSWTSLPYLLRWIGQPVYTEQMPLYLWIFAATAVNAIGMIPHYALYAAGHDRPIVLSHLAALPVFALSTWSLSYVYTVSAVPIGVLASFTFVLLWKTFAYLKLVRHDPRQNPPTQL